MGKLVLAKKMCSILGQAFCNSQGMSSDPQTRSFDSELLIFDSQSESCDLRSSCNPQSSWLVMLFDLSCCCEVYDPQNRPCDP